MNEIILDGSEIAKNATVFRKEVLRILERLAGRPGETEILSRTRVARIFDVGEGDIQRLGERLEIAFKDDQLANRGAPQSIPVVAGQLGDVTLLIAARVRGKVGRGKSRPGMEAKNKSVIISLPTSTESVVGILAEFPFLEGDPRRSTTQWCKEIRMLEGELMLTFVDSIDHKMELAVVLRFGPPSEDEAFAAASLKGMFEKLCGKKAHYVYTDPATGLQQKPTSRQRNDWDLFAGPFNNRDEANAWFDEHCLPAPTGNGYICTV